jgi:glycosyltransferase involved in cell wall biosynthesis
MVGDGCLREKIYLSIKNFNLDGRITLTGWRNDVALILSAFDIFVLTSLWEGLPIAVMEAMAAGVPVVATDTGGIKDVIQDGQSGYLAKPKDNKAICERIKELLANSQKRDEFARLAKKRISSREFSLNSMVKNTEELYFNLGREKKNV